ncbi:MAG: GNAT family N-acetyltransferase [Actinomycetia bacterium]|nr:GNAT family N-acetyltransferase [Actinomycetes bacterium]
MTSGRLGDPPGSRLAPGQNPSAETAAIVVEEWTGRQLTMRLVEAMDIYALAMRYPRQTGAQRAISARQHTGYRGFACRAAVRADGALVGFGYGYTTARGQWWHDSVRRAIPPDHAREWLTDSFELSEIHVLPECQSAGIGRRLLTSLAAGVGNRSILLSTPDADTKAFRLYRSVGFVDLARHYFFPGDGRPFAILGAHLPLREHA